MNIRYSFPRRGDYLRTQLIRFTYRFLSIRMNLLKKKKNEIFFYSLETTKTQIKILFFPWILVVRLFGCLKEQKY